MSRRLAIARASLLLATLTAPLGSRPAEAAVLGMQGSLEFRLSLMTPLTLPQTPGSLPVAVSTGGGSFAVPAGIFSGFVLEPFPTGTLTVLLSDLRLTGGNLAGNFAPGGGHGGGFGGDQPLTGFVRFGVLGLFTIPIPLQPVGATAASAQLNVAQLSVTVFGKNFTTGPAIVTGITTTLTRVTPSDTMGCPPILCGLGVGQLTSGGNPVTAHTVTLSGLDNRTPGHLGSVWLVSPAQVFTNALGILGAFAIERFTFVPEPGTALLLGSAAALAAAWGARCRRRRRR